MSVSVTTEYAIAAAMNVANTAPVTRAIALLANTAHTLRQIGVRRWTSVATSSTSIGGRGDLRLPRAEAAVALAGLRHPAAINATMARPAIQAEAVVSSVIDTQPDIVPIEPPAVRTPAAGHRWWAVPMAAVALLALVALLVASVLPATLRARTDDGQDAQFALVPSDAEPVADRLSFDAVERYPADGEFLFVTVREPEINMLDWLVGEGLSEVRLLSYTDKFGEQSPDQQRQFSVEMMRSAKETAQYVALSYLGFPAEIVPGDVIVLDLVCLEANADGTECVDYAPSDDVLDPGDQLLKVDGVELQIVDDLGPILEAHQPGDVVTVEFERPGEGTQTGEIELIASNDGTDRTIIGFQPFDTASADLPFDVEIDSGAIGGPSAGLAFTLTLIDEMTVTGTIQIGGDVGAIGGLVSKTSAVKQRGAKYFIVPSAQGPDDIARARQVAGDDLKIIPVDNLQQAIDALAELGGNGLDLGKPGADFQPSE
jgi:PDZ domain-containing protein